VPARADTKVALTYQGLTGLAEVALTGGAPDAALVVADSGGPSTLCAQAAAGADVTQAARDVLSRIAGLIAENETALRSSLHNIETVTSTLATNEFIRRFLIHVLPKGFHRIRHYGLLGNTNRAANIAHARKLLAVPSRPKEPEMPEAALDQPSVLQRPCPCCGGRMIVIETFDRRCQPKHRPTPVPQAITIDTS